jgi:hypothetical protein
MPHHRNVGQSLDPSFDAIASDSVGATLRIGNAALDLFQESFRNDWHIDASPQQIHP